VPEYQRAHLVWLQELATRILDVRPVGCSQETVARDLLAGFFDVCMRYGLDKILVDLGIADFDDRMGLADQPELLAALAARGELDLDDGGPRNAKPRLMAEALVASLGLTVIDPPDRTITLPGTARAEVAAAIKAVLDVELAVPQIRARFVAKARELCPAHYHAPFDKITAQLDDTGMRMIKQPKVPLDAMQAVARVLFDARTAVIERAANTAVDRALPVLARASADAAARIDQPITHRLTPRNVAIARVCEVRVPRTSSTTTAPPRFASLFDNLTELAQIAWQAPEKPVRTYGASQTFAVGDLIDHPKFGRGTVTALAAQRIDVEFDDGNHTLVHVAPRK
jgi:hypothetical protein